MEYVKRELLNMLLTGSSAVKDRCPGEVMVGAKSGCINISEKTCSDCWAEALGQILVPSEEETK